MARIVGGRIGLVERVDAGRCRYAYVTVGQDELAQCRIECESIDAVACGEHEHGGGVVGGVAGADELVAGTEDIRLVRLR